MRGRHDISALRKPQAEGHHIAHMREVVQHKLALRVLQMSAVRRLLATRTTAKCRNDQAPSSAQCVPL